MGSQCHALATLPPGKTRYPLLRRVGGPQGRSGLVKKISLPPGFDPRINQSVASCYTHYAILAHQSTTALLYFQFFLNLACSCISLFYCTSSPENVTHFFLRVADTDTCFVEYVSIQEKCFSPLRYLQKQWHGNQKNICAI